MQGEKPADPPARRRHWAALVAKRQESRDRQGEHDEGNRLGKRGRAPQQMEQDGRAVQQRAGEQVARPAQRWTEQVGQHVSDQAHLVGLGVASTIRVKCQD